MSGLTNIIPISITIISSIAFATDVFSGRIFNWLTFPAIFFGLIAVFAMSGGSALLNSALGAVTALILFGFLFFFKFIGGGDVKFLMALGAWGGFHFTLEVALLSILLGGIMAIIILIFRGRALDFALRMHQFLLSVFVKEFEIEKPQFDSKHQMPFGIPMAIAAIFLTWKGPLWFT